MAPEEREETAEEEQARWDARDVEDARRQAKHPESW